MTLPLSNTCYPHYWELHTGNFHPWIKKHLFGNYTVKSVEPRLEPSVLENVVRCKTQSCQWVKNRVCISHAQQVVIWLTPKTQIERVIAERQNYLAHAVEDGITRLIPTRYQKMCTSSGDLERIFQKRCYFFEIRYGQCIEMICKTALDDNILDPADKLRLLAGLRKTLITQHEKWINNDHPNSGEFYKRLINAHHYPPDMIFDLVSKLDEHLNQLIDYTGRCYCDEAKTCPPISGLLTDLQEQGHISRCNIYKMEKSLRELYQSKIQRNMNKLTERTYQIPETSIRMRLPLQFEFDGIKRRGIDRIHFGDQQPVGTLAQPVDPQKNGITQRISDFLQYLGEITENNQAAIYTLCAHLTQDAQNNMVDLISMAIKETLGLELIPNSRDIKRRIDIRPDEKDSSKIVITHSLTVRHNPDGNPKNKGPNALLPDTEPLVSDQYSYLSDYSPAWRDAQFQPSMKIIVDLRNPEQATVEPADLSIWVP